ncbi:MAG: type II toxin-antitoxin system HicA family toxin [Vicinamibacteria bacterium]
MSSDPEKLLADLKQNKYNRSLADLERVLTVFGWEFRRKSSSHRIWRHPGKRELQVTLVSRTGSNQLPAYVSEVCKLIEMGRDNNDE